MLNTKKIAGALLPYIVINKFEISLDDLLRFEMKNSSFLPSLNISFTDKTNLFSTRHFPKDGDVVSVYLRSSGDEKTYKPIRVDFDILNITPSNNSGDDANKYSLVGQMKVPGLFTEFIESFEGTGYDVLLDMSEKLKLGFASNVETTDDYMVWVNPNDTRLKFVKDLTKKIYANDDSFFKTFIDPYYNLNLIELNKTFSQEDGLPIGEISSTNLLEIFDQEDSEGVNVDTSPNIITNSLEFQGTNRYIGKYSPMNNSGKVFLSNGYKRFAQFFETPEDEFISEFVDPLTTEGTESMVHLKGRYHKGAPEGIADAHNKFKYLGKQDSSEDGNVHSNYLYSDILNKQNLDEIKKMGLVVDLNSTNMSFYRYQRIAVLIYQYSITEKLIKEKANENAGIENKENGTENAVVNEFLSGYYVIDGIEYIYKKPGPVRQRLRLIKREYNSPK